MNISQASPWFAVVRTITDDPLASSADEGAVVTATSAAVQNTFGAWVQVVAALGANGLGLFITMSQAVPKAGQLQIGVGGAGAEIPIKTVWFGSPVGTSMVVLGDIKPARGFITFGNRIAVRVLNSTDAAANAIVFGVTVLED